MPSKKSGGAGCGKISDLPKLASMTSATAFRVGVSPDWADWAPDTLGFALAEVLESLPDLEHEVMPDSGGKPTREILDRYDAVIAFAYPFPRESIAGVKRLCGIARWGVGFDSVDVNACMEADVLVALSPMAVRRPLAEGILAMIFTLTKNIRRLDQQARAGRWRDNLQCRSICIQGRTLGSVGLGNIASELFRMVGGMGFGRLLSFDPYAPRERAAELAVDLVDLDTLMRESDFVAINAPLHADTRGLIGARELALMRPTAYLINTSRGPLVDEGALVEALRQRRIAGAGLDVFENEPMHGNHPLYELDNVILTPHSVGWTEELIRDLNFETCRSVRAVYEGKVPAHLANPTVIGRAGMQAKLAARRKE
ncbi:MAG: dehydrogenase [Acidobacteria bacterium]|nr:dehydrogenase [Acidobacteriota bacterium]MCI0721507.1 dehydrogenase [Acidobacteriota bacterium]